MASEFTNNVQTLAQLTQAGHIDQLTQLSIHHDGPRAIKRPAMAPSTPDTYRLVGRDDVIGQIKAALLDGQTRSLSIQLAMGVGKTALACQLANDAALRAQFPDGILWANVGKAPDVRHELMQWATALLHEDELAIAPINGDVGSEAYWRRLLQQALANRRMLLVVDDVWSLDNGTAFKVGGNECAYLFTTRFPRLAHRLSAKVITLDSLSVAQGIELLQQFAPDAVAADPQAAQTLVERVGGLPQALIPVGCFLRDAASTGQSRRIREAMDKLDEVSLLFNLEQADEFTRSLPRSLRSVIEASYQWLGSQHGDGDALRSAIESLAILRPNPIQFSEPLAAHLCGATPDILNALCDAGMIEARGDHYTMHRTFAEYLRAKIGADRSRALHRRVTDFQRERLNALEEKYQHCDSAYAQWFRYEDREWGQAKDDWLYHMARAGEYQTVVTAFMRAWFDGFWWWACYLDFHFCDQLLREWQQREIRPESREGLRLLTRFKNAYPKESEDRLNNHRDRWSEVEAVLLTLRDRLGLDNLSQLPEHADARHLRGITAIFLAEARRFGAQDFVSAEIQYRDAIQQFAANHDDWDRAWAVYHLADMLRSQGRYAELRALCDAALILAVQQADPELQANLWRVLGDAALAEDHYDSAARAYRHAAFHAYRFQIEPELPDPYTICFYDQLGAKIAQRVTALHARAPIAALALAVALSEVWYSTSHPTALAELEAVLQRGDVLGLQTAIFPPSLAANQLQTDRDRYAAELRAHLAAITPPISRGPQRANSNAQARRQAI